MHVRSFFLTTLGSFLVVPLMAIAAPDWNPLPDTGQISCSDANGNSIPCPAEGNPFHGQDAQYSSLAPKFQDNADGTVTDLNSGLIWQKTDDGNKDWIATSTYCNDLTYAGSMEWRLPTRLELKSLLVYGRSIPANDPLFTWSMENSWEGQGWNDADGIPYNHSSWMRDFSYWWSSDLYMGVTDDGGVHNWVVRFYDGADFSSNRLNSHFIRCVRE
jgi:hypothetical protein